MYDLIIIGAGPAGITAAVYAARQKLNFCVISNDIGGQTAVTGTIENYTGYHFISGPELSMKFEDHIEQFGIDVKMPEKVSSVAKGTHGFIVQTDNEKYEARTVLVSSGKVPRTLNIPGEQEFKHRGLTYCAVCDGPLFGDKDVAVIGGANAALDAALQMMKIASKVYLITNNSELHGEKIRIDRVKTAKNIEIIYAASTTEVVGDTFVDGIIISQDGSKRNIPLEGVFVEIGWDPSCKFIDFIEKNEYGEIIVNNRCETNIPGVFAAGDVTNVPEKQIIIAAGEGAKAALGVAHYLSVNIAEW